MVNDCDWTPQKSVFFFKKPTFYVSSLDTKATILYNWGKVKEAIILEEEGFVDWPKYIDASENMKKMRAGKVLWSSKEKVTPE